MPDAPHTPLPERRVLDQLPIKPEVRPRVLKDNAVRLLKLATA